MKPMDQQSGNDDPSDPGSGIESAKASSAESAAPTLNSGNIVRIALILDIAMVALAVIFATLFDFHDLNNPLAEWFRGSWVSAVLVGAGIALPMVLLVLWGLPAIPALRPFFELVEEHVVPLFRQASWLDVLLISLGAGIAEEMLFRWCLQGGLMQYMTPAMAVLLASLVFGLMHYLCFTYFVLATLLGLLMGLVYLWIDPLAAVACHAAYDLLAIQWMVRQAHHGSESP